MYTQRLTLTLTLSLSLSRCSIPTVLGIAFWTLKLCLNHVQHLPLDTCAPVIEASPIRAAVATQSPLRASLGAGQRPTTENHKGSASIFLYYALPNAC